MNHPPINESGWTRHEREQTIWLARNSTPEQRLKWVEDMLTSLGRERIEAHRLLQEQADREDVE